ncbi:MAG TPA: hypothetical protein P5318_05840 [Candidatus Hydrogenedentes bacterium]|nr:hypothetical protein [Candidatus Hydrogenedentota bacterium]HPC15745.1 hypothetical protein [Candidatus Hydrogenedentota bacterium]HRT19631.1 hypothetical protein [Candidatus Hydrogenedentota bacterium]
MRLVLAQWSVNLAISFIPQVRAAPGSHSHAPDSPSFRQAAVSYCHTLSFVNRLVKLFQRYPVTGQAWALPILFVLVIVLVIIIALKTPRFSHSLNLKL